MKPGTEVRLLGPFKEWYEIIRRFIVDSKKEWSLWAMEKHRAGWERGASLATYFGSSLVLHPPALTPLARCRQHPKTV